MKLFNRDYSTLTEQEHRDWEIVKQKKTKKIGKMTVTSGSFYDYSKAVRHFTHIFPNNYLDPADLKNEKFIHGERDTFRDLLDADGTGEREILNHINKTQVYFLIGSLLNKYYSFGHHAAYIFPEFQLGNSYKVDYLIVGRNSHGYHLVFVELESPIGKITLANGNVGEVIRKGLAQIDEWKEWLESRYSGLAETFEKCLHPGHKLPDEFRDLDTSRLNYVVLAGRRNNFKDSTYKKSRTMFKESSTLLIHYDNVLDAATEITVHANY